MNNLDKQSLDELAQSFTNIGHKLCDFKQLVTSLTSQLIQIARRWRPFPSLNSSKSKEKTSSVISQESHAERSKDSQ